MPKDEMILYNLGRAYFAKQEYEKAQNTLEGLYSACPTPEIANILALTYLKLEKYQEGIRLLKTLTSQFKENAVAFLNLGEAYLKIGDYCCAIENLKRANEIFPGFEEAIIALGNAYLASGDNKCALEILEKGLEETDSDKIRELIAQI
jgi:tetratricopeptide (TPR) repeat protein